MSKFKVGDKVRCINRNLLNANFGEEYEVVKTHFLHGSPGVKIISYGKEVFYYDDKFELVEPTYPNPPHKHAELIKTWADGAEIEYYSKANKGWRITRKPVWYNDYEYRIKPQLTEQEIKAKEIEDQLAKAQEEVDKLTAKLREVGV